MKIPHVFTAALLLTSGLTLAQTSTTPAAAPATAPAAAPAQMTQQQLQDAQREAMKALAWMDGVWRGQATVIQEGGKKLELIHTERAGSFLDGTIKVIEGRSYTPDGQPGGFNALAVISYDPYTKEYEFRSYSAGNAGTFEATLPKEGSGYAWQIPAGPGQTVNYVATFVDGTWTEKGTFNAPGQPAVPIFEMNLRRVGDTDWPLTTPVPPK